MRLCYVTYRWFSTKERVRPSVSVTAACRVVWATWFTNSEWVFEVCFSWPLNTQLLMWWLLFLFQNSLIFELAKCEDQSVYLLLKLFQPRPLRLSIVVSLERVWLNFVGQCELNRECSDFFVKGLSTESFVLFVIWLTSWGNPLFSFPLWKGTV